MKAIFVALTGLLMLLLGGCAVTEPVIVSYDASQNATSYETRSLTISTSRSNALGLQGRQLLTMRAAAACMGRDCVPDEILLVFANAGENETALYYEPLEIEADDENYTWTDLLDREEAERISPGDFLRVPIARRDFERLAQAQEVTGSLGETPFRLSYDERAPFRELMLQLGPAQ